MEALSAAIDQTGNGFIGLTPKEMVPYQNDPLLSPLLEQLRFITQTKMVLVPRDGEDKGEDFETAVSQGNFTKGSASYGIVRHGDEVFLAQSTHEIENEKVQKQLVEKKAGVAYVIEGNVLARRIGEFETKGDFAVAPVINGNGLPGILISDKGAKGVKEKDILFSIGCIGGEDPRASRVVKLSAVSFSSSFPLRKIIEEKFGSVDQYIEKVIKPLMFVMAFERQEKIYLNPQSLLIVPKGSSKNQQIQVAYDKQKRAIQLPSTKEVEERPEMEEMDIRAWVASLFSLLEVKALFGSEEEREGILNWLEGYDLVPIDVIRTEPSYRGDGILRRPDFPIIRQEVLLSNEKIVYCRMGFTGNLGGMSGSPVVNMKGEFVGIHSGTSQGLVQVASFELSDLPKASGEGEVAVDSKDLKGLATSL